LFAFVDWRERRSNSRRFLGGFEFGDVFDYRLAPALDVRPLAVADAVAVRSHVDYFSEKSEFNKHKGPSDDCDKAQAHIVRGPVDFFIAQSGGEERDCLLNNGFSKRFGQGVERSAAVGFRIPGLLHFMPLTSVWAKARAFGKIIALSL